MEEVIITPLINHVDILDFISSYLPLQVCFTYFTLPFFGILESLSYMLGSIIFMKQIRNGASEELS